VHVPAGFTATSIGAGFGSDSALAIGHYRFPDPQVRD